MKFDFIAIDFETANSNYNSACSMGLVMVDNNKIVDKFYTLIQPPTLDFDDINMSIHGITPDEVACAPKFDEVWEKISHYFDGSNLITAYNAVFDMTVLKACLKEYNINFPDFEYICSLQFANRLYPDCDKHTLDCICNHLNISLDEHHNALADTLACSQIIIKSLEILKSESFETTFDFLSKLSWKQFSQVKEVKTFGTKSNKKSRFHSKISISDITPDNDAFDNNHPFYNKNFVFTGELSKLSRKEAMQKVVDVGGILKSGVSRATNYVVVGLQDKSIVGSDGLSTKEEKALALIEAGHPIEIISEDEFLKLLA